MTNSFPYVCLPKARLSSTGRAGDAHIKVFKFTAIIVSGGTSDAG
ncbi:MAG: hypothetical protein WCG81_07720 [Candidatus Angelobacter sp.]